MAESNEAMRERVRKAIQGQKPTTVTVLSSLLAVHDALGYLPKEAIEEVADTTHSTVNDVWGVASFYPNFRFEPPPAGVERLRVARRHVHRLARIRLEVEGPPKFP